MELRFLVQLGIIGLTFFMLINASALLVLAERKIMGFMQQRYGPYLVGPHGTLYAHGMWRGELKIPADYPLSPPRMAKRRTETSEDRVMADSKTHFDCHHCGAVEWSKVAAIYDRDKDCTVAYHCTICGHERARMRSVLESSGIGFVFADDRPCGITYAPNEKDTSH